MSAPTVDSEGQRNRNRWIRIAFIASSVTALVVGLAYLNALPGGVIGIAIFGGPVFLGYIFGVRSAAGSVFVGLSLLVLSIATSLYAIDERHSSTVGLVYLFLPFIGIPLVVAAVLLDRTIRSRLGSAVASMVLLGGTIGALLYFSRESPAESFCDHGNGLGNTMIEVAPGPLTASEAERLIEFHSDFVTDSEDLREAGLTESAEIAHVWAEALARLRDAQTPAERSRAYEHLRRVVMELYGSAGSCPDIR